MSAQTGKRYTCPKCNSEFIVTKGGEGELKCGDTPLELKKQVNMAVQLGKRYKDEETGIEVLVIKPGDCDLKIDDRDMELMQPKVLPSADQSLILKKTNFIYKTYEGKNFSGP